MKQIKLSYQEKLCRAAEQTGALTPDYFEKLPLGEVTVTQGWLRKQLDLMCEGITGRLPEFGPFFRPEQNGFLYPETASGWEEIPYWLRGFYPMAVLAKSQKHIKIAN